MSAPQEGRSRGCLYCFLAVGVVLLVVVGLGIYAGYEAMQEEFNLHSTLYVIRLVDHFVQEHGRWPESWTELEAMPFGSESPREGAPGTNIIRIGGAMHFNWPEQSAELRQRVDIDFTIDEAKVVDADVVEFQPIHPTGPSFNYWKYGFIEELQDSLREATNDKKTRIGKEQPDQSGRDDGSPRPD